jgi:hypothetical protein
MGSRLRNGFYYQGLALLIVVSAGHGAEVGGPFLDAGFGGLAAKGGVVAAALLVQRQGAFQGGGVALGSYGPAPDQSARRPG